MYFQTISDPREDPPTLLEDLEDLEVLDIGTPVLASDPRDPLNILMECLVLVLDCLRFP